MSNVVLQIKKPAMRGKTVRGFQKDLKAAFKRIGIDAPIKYDGIYGPAMRGYTAALLHANGGAASKLMVNGVTPALRSKIRNDDYTASEKKLKNSKTRTDYRAALRSWGHSAPRSRRLLSVSRLAGASRRSAGVESPATMGPISGRMRPSRSCPRDASTKCPTSCAAA